MIAKDFAKTCFKRAGLRVTRDRPPNRFQAMEETFTLLGNFGYTPRVVIDCGANVGQWTSSMLPIFPAAAFHLVEPQPGCADALQKLSATTPNVTIHPFALTLPGVEAVRMIGGGEDHTCTGNFVARDGESGADEQRLPATTLDQLFADQITAADRPLLKLDIEGHEVGAMEGGPRLLRNVEVILTEVRFYDINRAGRPIFAEVLNYLRDAVFVRRTSPLWNDFSWE